MAYVLCLLYVVVTYVRPGEIVPAWAGLPIAQVTGVVAAVAATISLVFKPRSTAGSSVDWCFFGFFLTAVISNPAQGWVGGGYKTFLDLLPLACFFFLIRVAVRSLKQLRGLILLLVLLTLYQGIDGIVQYYTGTGVGGATVLAENIQRDPAEDETESIMRIRGTGIFNDPNDLALSLLIVFPFLFSAAASSEKRVPLRVCAAAAIVVLGWALLLTHSRGGLVGAAALVAAYAYRRFGRAIALPVGAVILVALLIAATARGRIVDSEEDSAQGRVQAWAAGLEMFKSSPVVGVGFGQFTDNHELVAHNSLVHTFAELGFLGAVFLVGMFFWLFAGTGRRRNVAGAASSGLAAEIWASGVGVVACAWFLSRQYVPILYIPVALGATWVSVASTSADGQRMYKRGDWVRIVGLTCVLMLAVYIAVRVFAVWSG